MTPELLVLHCPTCARDALAEAPPCLDGHGELCPDRACVECGTALALDVWTLDFVAAAVTRTTRRAA